ncbi:Hypothetical protein NTJ_08838 [Nesidiocoris tenuis]|uniref:Peptidase S1 domain-containing protein n=1 Tax=Nesidiocoris tenuis TaxID=355587 RepID=A0ABN7AV16_9HEMI|nr:Hypothetical protein NTJ_08838 [Nesidiocoris tenuis]
MFPIGTILIAQIAILLHPASVRTAVTPANELDALSDWDMNTKKIPEQQVEEMPTVGYQRKLNPGCIASTLPPYPFVVEIWNKNTKSFITGGTILTPNHVIAKCSRVASFYYTNETYFRQNFV